MSIGYITPQRSVIGRITRFVRRAGGEMTAGNSIETGILSCFTPQLLIEGERRTVHAEFSYGSQWEPVSALFTLLAAGAGAPGYVGVSCELASDTNGSVWTATAMIDITPGAAHPLEPGIYEGEFLLTTSAGEIVGASGGITITNDDQDSGQAPDDYETGGGVG